MQLHLFLFWGLGVSVSPNIAFVSGVTSASGEQCLVAGNAGIYLEPCSDAIAAGDGREVLQFDNAHCLN